MRAGIFAKTFAPGPLEAVLDSVAATGVDAVQFNLALLGGSPLPSRVEPRAIATAHAALAARGLDVVALSGTYNMAHPDPEVRARGASALAAAIGAAPALGASLVTLCTGSRDADDLWRAHPANATAAAWSDMVASVSAALAVADSHGVDLGIEPESGNVVCDAPAARRLLDELGSPRLRIVFDAANLISATGLARQDTTLDEAFALLGDDVVLAHAKDLDPAGTVVAAGRGRLDYAGYLNRLRAVGFDGAVVLHGLAPGEVAASVAFLDGHLRAAEPA